MQLTNILAAAILALGASAAPSIESRTSAPSCYGGQVYNDAHKSCVCPPQQNWDDSKKKCCYPPMAPPSCGNGENKWCSKSKNEYCKYDQKNDFCENNGYNSVWCSKDKDVPDKCKEKYPDTKPTCKDKQQYNCDTKMCECPKPMYWKDNDQKCHYPVMPKPTCDKDKKAYCGKTKDKYCGYDELSFNIFGIFDFGANKATDNKQSYCENDGTCYSFCAKDVDLLSLVDSIFDLL